jgi:hypothetical protein
MKAIVQDAYGIAPENVFRLDEIDQPTIRGGEVLVPVHAAGVDRGRPVIQMPRSPMLMRIMAFGFRRPKALNPAGVWQESSKRSANRSEFKPGNHVNV